MNDRQAEGVIRKALSGFYYVQVGAEEVTCRARGKFRHKKIVPLVGDRVQITCQPDGGAAWTRSCPAATPSSVRRWPTSTSW